MKIKREKIQKNTKNTKKNTKKKQKKNFEMKTINESVCNVNV